MKIVIIILKQKKKIKKMKIIKNIIKLDLQKKESKHTLDNYILAKMECLKEILKYAYIIIIKKQFQG